MTEHEFVKDPRPDLAYDSHEWSVFLSLLHKANPNVAGILHGFRCGGLRIDRGGRGYALRPDFDPKSSIWANGDEYRADRDKWLVPHTDLIVRMLGFMNRHEESKRKGRSA